MKPSVSVLRELHAQIKKAGDWISNVPNEISDAFFDNPYTDGLSEALAVMMRAYFGEDDAELFYDVIFCGVIDGGLTIDRDGYRFNITSFDELCDYLVTEEGWLK